MTENFLVSEAQLINEQVRKEKAKRLRSLGEPIELSGKALALELYNNVAWIAENTTVVRKIDLETGKTLGLFKGHTGPVTSIAFYAGFDTLITGSWDKSIRLWNTKTSQCVSVTPEAHSDFVKTLLVLPSLRLLVSGSSDKVVRFWDLSHSESLGPLHCTGSISSHTRPVECLDGRALSDDTAVLYTGDTMGVIKVWNLKREDAQQRWSAVLQDTIDHHRTRINELCYGNGQLWSASADETIRVIPDVVNLKTTKSPDPIKQPVAVRAILPLNLTDLSEPYLISAAGDVLRTFDVSSVQEPELLSEFDAHWHEITCIRLWMRISEGDSGGRKRVEPWIVTTGLDRTIRKWKLADLLNPPPDFKAPLEVPKTEAEVLTEEELRELDELMSSD